MRRFPFLLSSVFACSLFAISAHTAVAQSATPATVIPTPRITQAVDGNVTVTLRSAIHPLTAKAQDLGAAADSLQIDRTILLLQRSSSQKTALAKMLHDQQDSKSHGYHQWLTPSQFGEQFGASPADIATITNWLESNGLRVEPVMPGRSEIIFSGTSGQLRNAFHVQLHSYSLEGKTYWANANKAEVPAALAPVIRGFSSLNNFPKRALHTEPKIIRKTDTGWKLAQTNVHANFTTTQTGSTLFPIGPSDLATIYNIKPLWNAGIDGSGQTIAVVSDSNIKPADVDYFRSVFGLPAKKLNILFYGQNPGYTQDEGEAALDVEWAGAVAKNATIDLVVAANTPTSGGIDGAAIYVINNNLASILNVSYGTCEPALGTEGNQFYSQIWEQAAAQGITVFVAAGDSGSAVCDQNQLAAQYGLTVNGIASTPYNIAVGGTDLYGTFTDPAVYWKPTNDPTTLESVISYIPELPWNNSCASPQLLSALEAQGYPGSTNTAFCNDGAEFNFVNTIGGSGGASKCAVMDASGNCQGGYPKPEWQSGIAGIPSDGVRDVPDVSLMAGNGLWNTFYAYCQSDITPNGVCDVNTALEGAGGTSFASPIYAGIMALVQQQTNASQGNANYVLYKMAAAQYASSGTDCDSAGSGTSSTCIFHDITAGNNAVPCYEGALDCPSTGDFYGILPGYDATAGFDLATGLGSVNVTNLVNAWSSYSSTFLPVSVSLSASGPTTVPYGTNINLKVAVASLQSNSATPGGDVGVTSDSTSPDSRSIADGGLSNGTAAISAQGLATGSYQLYARYAGDGVYAPGVSTGLPVIVTQAAPVLTLTTSLKTVEASQNATISLGVGGVSGGASPTGTVTFTDSTSGVVLGKIALSPSPTTDAVLSNAYITISRAQLQKGINSISATYTGDTNYTLGSSAPVTVTSVDPFSTTINPTSLTIARQGSGTVMVAVTPNGSAVLASSDLTLSCPSGVPAGMSCSFGAPVVGKDGSLSYPLTLTAPSALLRAGTSKTSNNDAEGWKGTGALAGLSFLCLAGFCKRNRKLRSILLLCIASILVSSGCAGGNDSSNKSQLIPTATTLAINPTSPTYNTPATLTATVAATSSSGSPTGPVTFVNGSSVLGTASPVSGVATLRVASLPVGKQAVSAVYSGDTAYSSSVSPLVNVDIGYTSTIIVMATDKAGNSSSGSLLLTIQ